MVTRSATPRGESAAASIRCGIAARVTYRTPWTLTAHQVVPVLQRRFGRRRHPHQPGVVHHGVQPSQLVDGALHRGGDLVGVGHVGGHRQRRAAGRFDVGFQLMEPIGAAGQQRDGGALVGQCPRGRGADAAAGAGDQRHGAGQCLASCSLHRVSVARSRHEHSRCARRGRARRVRSRPAAADIRHGAARTGRCPSR